jgi:protein-L-isoaspartate O-methyltransferase
MHARIRPNRGDWTFAEDLFARYQAKEGSRNAARPVSLAHLAACLRTFRPRTVLEMGAGIGTMTDALLSHHSGIRRIVAFEHNDFCLAALARNIDARDSRLTIVARREELPAVITDADMLVADGNYGRAEAYDALRLGTVIFVEGNRKPFRDECCQALQRRGLTVTFREHGARYGLKISTKFRRKHASRLWLPVIKRFRRTKGCWIGQVSAART